MRGNKEKMWKWGTAQTGSEPLTSLDLLNEIEGGFGLYANSGEGVQWTITSLSLIP